MFHMSNKNIRIKIAFKKSPTFLMIPLFASQMILLNKADRDLLKAIS